MRKKLTIFTVLLLVFFLASNAAHASHRGQVLGESTQATDLQFSSLSSGPGLILPNSPFFFLDKIFQQVKLAAAGSPEDKAKIRAQIIGERMAELRIMLSQDNQKDIDQALQNLTDESGAAADELVRQAADGANVEEAAKNLNEALKEERDTLDSLSEQSDGSLQLELESAREEVKTHKIKVEDELPEELLQNEIEDEIENEIEDSADKAEDETAEIEDHLDELEHQASEAARRNEDKRLKAIQKAIETKNEQLKKENELLLKQEKIKAEAAKKQQELLREKAKKAAEAAKELQKQSKESVDDSGQGSGSSGSSNSGSNSGSGSGSSGGDGEGHGGGED